MSTTRIKKEREKQDTVTGNGRPLDTVLGGHSSTAVPTLLVVACLGEGPDPDVPYTTSKVPIPFPLSLWVTYSFPCYSFRSSVRHLPLDLLLSPAVTASPSKPSPVPGAVQGTGERRRTRGDRLDGDGGGRSTVTNDP